MYAKVVKRENGGTTNYYIATQVWENGERKSKTIGVRKALGLNRPASYKEAKKLLKDIMSDKHDLQYTRMKLEDYLDKWLGEHSRLIKESTVKNYESVINRYVKPALGTLMLTDLTAQDIKDLHTAMLKQELSHSTIRFTHTILKAALKQGVLDQYLPSNPMEHVKPPRNNKPKVSYLAWEDAVRLRTVTANDRYHIYYQIALSTGMTRSEILGLRWKDVDTEAKTISVNNTFVTVGGKNYIGETTKTSSRQRTIDISAKLVEFLQAHKETQAKEREVLGFGEAEYVITTTKGGPLHPTNLSSIIKRTAENLNLPHVSSHGLRHTYATRLLEKGVHPKIVSERLGHANIQITLDTYSHAVPRLGKEAAELTD